MKRVLQALLVFGLSLQWGLGASLASHGKVTGRVNNDLGSPLSGATVLLSTSFDFRKSVHTAVTDKEGNFSLPDLEPGQYAVRVTQKGYQPSVKAPVEVAPGATTTLVLILQNLVAFGKSDDPANWDFKTALRSSRLRRLIFRGFDSTLPGGDSAGSPPSEVASVLGNVDPEGNRFDTNGSMEVYTTGPFEFDDYYSLPVRAGGGLKTNFGYSLPLGQDSRYLFAGQVNSGYDSLWRIKNQLDLKLNDFQLLTFSVNYGRLGFSAPRMTTLLNPSTISSDTNYVSERGFLQTLTFGVQSQSQLLSPLTLVYGMDLAVLHGADVSAFATPSLEVYFEPKDNLTFRGLVAAKRPSESNAITLSNQETIDLSEPFRISQTGALPVYDRRMHYEFGVGRKLPSRTTAELAVFADRRGGGGLPLMAVLETGRGRLTHPFTLGAEEANAEGLRLLVHRQLWDFLSSSVAYVYGSGATISGIDIVGGGTDSIQGIDVSKEFYHSLTTQVDATLDRTKTFVSTMFRWVPGSPITTLDDFSDYYNLGNGSLRLTVRQVIPVPDLLGMSGRWEALFDMRNLLEIDDNHFELPQGNLYVIRNPRYLRLGIAFRM